jgi:hypothetical protein
MDKERDGLGRGFFFFLNEREREREGRELEMLDPNDHHTVTRLFSFLLLSFFS